jgi:dihydrofolate synthase/folylpolyglutamate synthase
LLGEHQQINAAVAVGLAECLQEAGEPITPRNIQAGLADICWPGRLQVVQDHPLLILDGAHDPASIAALLAALDRHFPAPRRRYLLGFSREKDWPRMIRQLAPTAEEFIVTAVATPRAAPPALLAEEIRALSIPVTQTSDVATALQLALACASADDMICVTGSLYVVGDALKWAKDNGHFCLQVDRTR